MEEPIIGTLLDALDQNKRFKSSAYYSINFGTLPSGVRLALSTTRIKGG